jgi:hypothetical protein
MRDTDNCVCRTHAAGCVTQNHSATGERIQGPAFCGAMEKQPSAKAFCCQYPHRHMRMVKLRLISSHIVGGFQESTTKSPTTVFAYYCLGRGRVQTASQICASLLKQLCQCIGYIPSLLQNASVTWKKAGLKLSQEELLRCFEKLHFRHSGLSPVWVLLDAWDEMNMRRPEEFEELLRRLQALEWRILIMSRSSPSVTYGSTGVSQYWIRPEHSRKDIEAFVNSQIERSPAAQGLLNYERQIARQRIDINPQEEPPAHQESLQERLVKTIVGESQGT